MLTIFVSLPQSSDRRATISVLRSSSPSLIPAIASLETIVQIIKVCLNGKKFILCLNVRLMGARDVASAREGIMFIHSHADVTNARLEFHLFIRPQNEGEILGGRGQLVLDNLSSFTLSTACKYVSSPALRSVLTLMSFFFSSRTREADRAVRYRLFDLRAVIAVPVCNLGRSRRSMVSRFERIHSDPQYPYNLGFYR